MTIIEMELDKIIPYENNPRRNDDAVDYVAESIKQFGFKVPIILDKDNVIVAGHTRYKAALKLGFEVVPCLIADDLTEEQIKAFRLADNKTSEKADWDFNLLDLELSEILDIDMSSLGFDTHEEIDWTSVEDLTGDTYEQPEKECLKCPHCGFIDTAIHFKKADKEDENIS